MKVKVRLFGTLGKKFPDHDPLIGFEVEIPKDANVGDLIDQLDISKSKIGFVSVHGRLVKADKALKQGDYIRIYGPIFGG
ncbi:MAG: MoaD/ThiS family protein [Deltaproteobacteria bacterium]|nr:MoaD/ThiS family protein [Deltaproteobacteria bacterium]